MDYTIKAIPTEYNSVVFRSRLEAKWAAFFDLCNWSWEYEPFDIEGWVPDFIIRGKNNNLLVEVKPLTWSNNEKENYFKLFESRVVEKLFHSNREEVLLLGAYPIGDDNFWGSSFGLLVQAYEDKIFGGETPIYSDHLPDLPPQSFSMRGYSDHAVLNFGKSYKYDISGAEGHYTFRLGCEYEGDHHLNPTKKTELERLWRTASNTVQKQFHLR